MTIFIHTYFYLYLTL